MDALENIFSEVLNNRIYNAFIEAQKDEETKKQIRVLKVIAKKHGLSFMEMLTIAEEIAVGFAYEE